MESLLSTGPTPSSYMFKALCLQVEKYNREHMARKLNLEVTTKDMFDRQQVAGDPISIADTV